jgi:hypothetical protein
LSRYSLPSSGVSYSLVFEMILAAKWRGLSDEQLDALPLDSQVRILAAYRASQALEAVQQAYPRHVKRRRR